MGWHGLLQLLQPAPSESVHAKAGLGKGCELAVLRQLLLQAAGLDKGATRPGHDTVGRVSVKQIYEIAKVKQQDAHMAHLSLQSICRALVGSCRSMGLEVYSPKDAPAGPA